MKFYRSNLVWGTRVGIWACLLFAAGCTSLNSTNVGPETNLSDPKVASALAFAANDDFAKGLTAAERRRLTDAERQALDFGKSGEAISWSSKRGGISGSIIASQPFRVGRSDCRRFSHQMNRAGQSVAASGTACKRPGQPWKLVR